MTEKIQKLLRDSKGARWFVLATVSFTMLTGYFIADVISPLGDMLADSPLTRWSPLDFGFVTGAYSWFNVFFLMLIFGGIILDKMGIRFTGNTFVSLMIVGTAVKYYALTETFANGGFGYDFFNSFMTDYSPSAKLAALGFAIFGVGVEIAGITVSKIIVKWFKGKEMALAMGLEMATARIGMLLAMWLSPRIVSAWGNISLPVGLGLLLLCIGLISFLIHSMMDAKLDKQIAEEGNTAPAEEFKISDLKILFTNKAFLYISFLCVLFYSAVFPFMKWASTLMVHKYGADPATAGDIPGLLPLGTMALTPLFGYFLDNKGKAASIMIFGSLLLILVHMLYAVGPVNSFMPYFCIILLGIAFSLVPASMWPSVPKIVDDRYLGSAYAAIFWIQNWGLMAMPTLIGIVLNAVNPGVAEQIQAGVADVHYDFTIPMLMFASTGVLGLVFAFLLKREDKKKGYGLELPNIKK